MADAENYGYNQPGFKAHLVACAVVNRNYQLPYLEVPEGHKLLLKGSNTNGGMIWITGEPQVVNNPNDSYVLVAGETLVLRVQNAECLYVAAQVAGESVNICVEQAR